MIYTDCFTSQCCSIQNERLMYFTPIHSWNNFKKSWGSKFEIRFHKLRAMIFIFLQGHWIKLAFKYLMTGMRYTRLYTVRIWNPTIWNPETLLKVGFQMVQFSNGRASALVSFSFSLNHSKAKPSVSFCPDFKWFLTKWQLFVWISNGWASRFQVPFEIQTICNPTSFGPFKIQTRSDFRSPLCGIFFENCQTKTKTV